MAQQAPPAAKPLKPARPKTFEELMLGSDFARLQPERALEMIAEARRNLQQMKGDRRGPGSRTDT